MNGLGGKRAGITLSSAEFYTVLVFGFWLVFCEAKKLFSAEDCHFRRNMLCNRHQFSGIWKLLGF